MTFLPAITRYGGWARNDSQGLSFSVFVEPRQRRWRRLKADAVISVHSLPKGSEIASVVKLVLSEVEGLPRNDGSKRAYLVFAYSYDPTSKVNVLNQLIWLGMRLPLIFCEQTILKMNS